MKAIFALAAVLAIATTLIFSHGAKALNRHAESMRTQIAAMP